MRTVVFVALGLLVLGVAAQCGDVPGPLGVTSRSIGGGALNTYTPGVENAKGLNNIGLLVRMWGKVVYKNDAEKYFYIDDGYGRDDGSGHQGVRVSYDNLAMGESFTPPGQDDYVAITGISSTVLIGGTVQPNLLPRRGADVTTY